MLNVDEVKKNLRSLERLAPGELPVVYEFAEFLADQLRSDVRPEEFYGTLEGALNAMWSTGCIHRDAIISSPVSMASCQIIRERIVELGYRFLPEKFADRVKEQYEHALKQHTR